MASCLENENSLSTVRTPVSPPKSSPLFQARSAVFNVDSSQCFTPGTTGGRENQQSLVKPSTNSQTCVLHFPQSKSKLQPHLKPGCFPQSNPRASYLDQEALPQLHSSVTVCLRKNHFASGNTLLPHACLPVFANKASPPASTLRDSSGQKPHSTAARLSCFTAHHQVDSADTGGSNGNCWSGLTKDSKGKKLRSCCSSTQLELNIQKSPGLKVRSLKLGQTRRQFFLGKRTLPPQTAVFTASAVSTVITYPTCPCLPKTPTPGPSDIASPSERAMPTNQSSPWGSTKLRAGCKPGTLTATSITTPTKPIIAPKVPSGEQAMTPQELARAKELANSSSTSCSSLYPSSTFLSKLKISPSVAKEGEKGDESNGTIAQSPFMPRSGAEQQEGSRTQIQQPDGVHSPNQIGGKLVFSRLIGGNNRGVSLEEMKWKDGGEQPAADRSSCLTEAIGKLTEGLQLQHSSQSKNAANINRPQSASDATVKSFGLETESPVPGCLAEPVAQPVTARNTGSQCISNTSCSGPENQPRAKLCSSVPTVPSLCLTPSNHQEVLFGEDTIETEDSHNLDNTTEKQSRASREAEKSKTGTRTNISPLRKTDRLSTAGVSTAETMRENCSFTAAKSYSVTTAEGSLTSPVSQSKGLVAVSRPATSVFIPLTNPIQSPVTSSLTTTRRTSHSESPTTTATTVNNQVTVSPSLLPRNSQSTTQRRSDPVAVTPPTAHPKSGAVPAVPGATVCVNASQEKHPIETDPLQGTAFGLASVGSVTNQISAFHLTKQGEPASFPSSSFSPSSPSSLPSQQCVVVESQTTGHECVAIQGDGNEEEFPDELENDCSDDDDSDCSFITGASSIASIAILSSIEEPMLSGGEDDQEERPALVPSLFPLCPPTLYFSTSSERVELLPPEQRRLLKWKMSTVTPNVVKHTIARSHFKVTKKSHDWLGCWGHHMKSPGFKAIREYQKLNHFPGSFQIGRKDRLWRNLSKMQTRFGKSEFSFFPRSFVLPQDIKLLRKAWDDAGSKQKWIIKPPASARGIGIQVIHKWSQMPRKRPLLVQKYLHKPYLISGNKFDLRIYVYVTSYDPLRIYIFSDGLVRFASCKYSSSMKSLSNKFMHLTNYSVNKKNSDYQNNSDNKACQGHKWALKALWQYLGSKGVNTTLIWEKIKDIVIKTIIASDPYVNSLLKMNVRSAYSCHELFGFDIMLDENLKPWVLEVNISPSLHSNTALDVAIKGQMIRDLLNLAGFLLPQREDVVASSGSSATSSTSSLSGGSRDRTRPELSVDEKVKRAFYLTQRFADQDFKSTVMDILTPDDVRVLAESEDELSRKGEFERVFPSASSSRYLRFFECPRYLNILLDQWEQRYCNDRTKGINLLMTLCQRGVHLGTTDPSHIWSKCSYFSRIEPNTQDISVKARSGVVVSQQCQSPPGDEEQDCSDRDIQSVSSSVPGNSLPASPSPGSSAATSCSNSRCPTPNPSCSLT